MKITYTIFILILLFTLSCSDNSEKKTVENEECSINSDCINFGENYICENSSQKCVFDCSKCSELESCSDDKTSCIPISGRCSKTTDCSYGFNCNSNGFCEDNSGVIETTINWLNIESSLLNKQIKTTSNILAIAYSQTGNIKGLYLQNSENPYSGIYIYFTTAGSFSFEIGSNVEVVGVLDNQTGKKRVRTDGASVTILNDEKKYFNPITIDYFDENISQFESMLVNIKLDSRFNMTLFLPQHYIFSDESGKEIFVKDTLNIGVLNKISLNDKLISLVGVLDYEDSNFRVFPITENDIVVKTPICSGCSEWESCLDDSLCVLSENRCNQTTDCELLGAICDETHYCKAPFGLENGDIELWSENTPTDFFIGDALTISKESEIINSGSFSAKVTRVNSLVGEDKTKANILSPKVAVDNSKNYNFSIFVYDDDNNVDARVTYEIYNSLGSKIGSGVPYSNDGYTQNSENWQQLYWSTDFLMHLWSGNELTDIDSIRFGVRLYKDHSNNLSTGDGYIFIDNLSIDIIE